MFKWWRTYWHCLFLTVFRPSEDHRMCSTTERGAFCNCGYMNDGVTFDQEVARAVRKIDENRRN